MGKFDGYWEMREGGPYDTGDEVFKCTDCGEVSSLVGGWDGRPDPACCRHGCKNRDLAASDWTPGKVSAKFRDNYARIFGHD